jgi:hypothetical protein
MEDEPKIDVNYDPIPLFPTRLPPWHHYLRIRIEDPEPIAKRTNKERISDFFADHIIGIVTFIIILFSLFFWGACIVKILQSDEYDRRLLFIISFYYSAVILAIGMISTRD